MQDKILVICASRGRPKRCLEMIESFQKTSTKAVLKIYLDMCDPCLNEYRDLISKHVSYCIGFRRPSTTILINESWQSFAECFKWFSVTNDDFIYRTKEWDTKLLSTLNLHGGQGVVYGNDVMNGQKLPTSSIVSSDIVKALGWLQMPRLTHLFGDTVWQHLAEKSDCLFYREDVIIQHAHHEAGKYAKDDTYKETNCSRMYDIDQLAFMMWLQNEASEDIRKVKSVVDKTLLKIQ